MIVDQAGVWPVILDPIYHNLQTALGVTGIITNQCTCDYSLSPGILAVDLCDGNIKFAMQARQQWFQATAFFL